VLPDRWKSTDYKHPVYGTYGLGTACLLVVDNNDRRGEEQAWVSIADTIGMTKALKYGAHNGWHAAGDQDMDAAAARVYVNGGIPGSSWDFYNVKASESLSSGGGHIGNRLAYRNSANTQVADKVAKLGPTPEMMSVFYTMMYLFSGDLNSGVMGPFDNKTQDDCGLIKGWLQLGDDTDPNRVFHAGGDGFVESNYGEGDGSPQYDLNVNVLGLTLRSNSYTLASSNTERSPDVIASAALASPASVDYFGVINLCTFTNDVLERSPGALNGLTTDLAVYEPYGTHAPYTCTVSKAHSGEYPWLSAVDGFRMSLLGSRFYNDTKGRSRYFYELYNKIFSVVCTSVGTPVISLDVPTAAEGRDFVELASGNPMRTSSARISLALAKADLVDVKVFDVSGRLVKAIANGQRFDAGVHSVAWDGTDNSGSRVARGVYFTQVKYRNSNFTEALKLTVLK